MAAQEIHVVYSGRVEARAGRFHVRYKPRCPHPALALSLSSAWFRYFVMTSEELLWYKASEDFYKSRKPEKRMLLERIASIEQYPPSDKYPALFYLQSTDQSKWELRWPSMMEARPWVRRLPLDMC